MNSIPSPPLFENVKIRLSEQIEEKISSFFFLHFLSYVTFETPMQHYWYLGGIGVLVNWIREYKVPDDESKTVLDLIKGICSTQRHLDNWILRTRRYNEVTLIKEPRGRKQKVEGKKQRESEREENETAHKAEGVIESGAVIQSSQDAVMKLPLSSILSAWYGQLPASSLPELSKKLCCISD